MHTHDKIKLLIVEDDKKAREVLKNMLKELPYAIEIIGETGKVADALKLIAAKAPNLLLLDIELEDGMGFDLLEQLKSIDFEIIFTTAFDHYAIKAFQFSALHYLLKPIDQRDLQIAMNRFIKIHSHDSEIITEQIEILLENIRHNQQRKIAIRESSGIQFIRIASIIRCEAEANYTRIYLNNGQSIVSAKTLKEYEQLLGNEDFLRIHHSHLINLTNVKKYKSGRGGKVKMEDDSEVEVAVRKKEELLKRMKLAK